MLSRNRPGERKCLVLLSGGIDSATVAYWMKRKGYCVEALFFDFGRNEIDGPRESARIVAQNLGVHLHVVKTSLWGELLEDTARISEVYWPSRGNSHKRVLLFGNASCLCALAITYALMLDISSIVLGIHRGDTETDDGLQKLPQMLEKLARAMTARELEVLTPFRRKNKATVLRIAMRLGVPLVNTWSCGRDADVHCGTCIDCLERQRAFREVGLMDPTKYKALSKSDSVLDQQN